jgi:hypothetical protein
MHSGPQHKSIHDLASHCAVSVDSANRNSYPPDYFGSSSAQALVDDRVRMLFSTRRENWRRFFLLRFVEINCRSGLGEDLRLLDQGWIELDDDAAGEWFRFG